MKNSNLIKGVVAGVVAALMATTAIADPVRGGVANVVVQPEPPGLMLGVIQNGPTQMVAGNIYESLLKYDGDLNAIPNLATAWTISDDGLVYTFDIKQGVKWHDGAAFTAHDVVFTADVFLRETHPRFRVAMERVKTVEALDDFTVQFTLNSPFGPFLGMFETGTMPLVPKHIYEGTDFRNNPANNTPVGTGPFKFDSWERGSNIHLVRNEDYHVDGLPYLDEMYWHVIPDAAARAVAFETGQIDILPGGSVEAFDVPRLIAMDNVCSTDKGWEFFAPHSKLEINTRSGPMADARFRQAVMYAMDREFYRDVIWNGFGMVANGPIGSRTRFHDAALPEYSQDKDRARELLKEMGYDETPVRLLALPYGETWQRWAEAVRQHLEDVGIKVEIVTTDVAGWGEKIGNWDFDLAFNYLYQYGDPALGVARLYVSTNISKGSPWNNVSGYENAEVDRLFEEASIAFRKDDRQALYSEVQNILVKDVPYAWLLELEFPTIYRCDVKNLVTTAIGVNDGFADAWIE